MATAKNPDYVQSHAPQVDAQKNPELAAVVLWVDREFRALSSGLIDKTALELRPIAAAPPNPREGMIVYADGTNWNPGSGKGLYVYKAAWTFIV